MNVVENAEHAVAGIVSYTSVSKLMRAVHTVRHGLEGSNASYCSNGLALCWRYGAL